MIYLFIFNEFLYVTKKTLKKSFFYNIIILPGKAVNMEFLGGAQK